MDRIVVFLYLKFSSALLAAPGQPAGNNFHFTSTLLRLFRGVNIYFQKSFRGGTHAEFYHWRFAPDNHGYASLPARYTGSRCFKINRPIIG